jgi:hypothetical protein
MKSPNFHAASINGTSGQRIPNRNCSPVRNNVSRGRNTRIQRARNANSWLILGRGSSQIKMDLF